MQTYRDVFDKTIEIVERELLSKMLNFNKQNSATTLSEIKDLLEVVKLLKNNDTYHGFPEFVDLDEYGRIVNTK